MSEYQYYEFRTIDRPLGPDEMAQLRAVSTRAEITPSSFVNHYEWGDLKADPSDWMRRYFDAFVYSANWCSCRLSLRVPLATLSEDEVASFGDADGLRITASDTHWIIDWCLNESENYDRFGMDDGSGWIRRLMPLRDELLCGDLRALYLGWLATTAGEELADDAPEPEVPPGLSALTPAQQALVEFLEIDSDMLAAAIAGSAPLSGDAAEQAGQLQAWLGQWSRGEMADVLKLIVQGQEQQAQRQVKTRHAAWLKAQRPACAAQAPQRSVGQLRELAQAAESVRLERQAQERAQRNAQRRLQHEAHLRQLMTDVDQHWAAIDAQMQRPSGTGYKKVVSLLAELAQGYALTSSRAAFDQLLGRWLAPYTRRSALMRGLAEAGLWRKAS